MEVQIKKGKILIYRVFDLGPEIDLEKVEAVFNENLKEKFRLDRKNNSSLIISKSPTSIYLGKVPINVDGESFEASLICKVWHFGTASLSFHIPITDTTWSRLEEYSAYLDAGTEIDEIAKKKVKEFQVHIKDALPELNQWDTFEDYMTFFIEEFSDKEMKMSELPLRVDIPKLLLAEKKGNLSHLLRSKILENSFQYFDDDMVVVDWNSALIVEPSGSMDVALIIEFALNQLLEMRYYDEVLDNKLAQLYSSVVGKKRRLLSNEYSNLAEEAGQMYLEISEIFESIENSFKTVGDFYLATIFRHTTKRFKLDDWTRSINEKLSNLAEVSKLLHSEVNESRSQSLEIIIIILIAIEVVPFLYGLL